MRAFLLCVLLLAACSESAGPEWCRMEFHFTLPDSMPTIEEALADTTLAGVEPDSVTVEPCQSSAQSDRKRS